MKKSINVLLFCMISFNMSHAESIYAWVYPDSVVIGNSGVYTNCGSLFIFEVSRSNDTIFVTEIDTSVRMMTCTCTFTLTTTLCGLDPGHYWVKVYRKPNPLATRDTLLLIGMTEFTFGKSDLVYSHRGIQSACSGWGPDAVEDKIESAPHEFILHQNYPNPFNPVTTIRFSLRMPGFTSLVVYDILGRTVAVLVSREMSSGVLHSVLFNASELPSGMYFYRLQRGEQTLVKKLLISK